MPFLVSCYVLPMNSIRARPSRELERWPRIPSGGTPPCLSQGSSSLTQPSHQSCSSGGCHGWNLTEASRNVAETSTRETKHHAWRVGELRFITLVGPEELTLQALSLKQRGYRVFIDTLQWAHKLLIGWFKLRGFTHVGKVVKTGRGMPDQDRHD